MTTSSTGFSGLHQRLTHLFWYFVVLTAALLLALFQPAVWAQEPAPLDPPGRVARLNLAEGAVSFAPADSNAWTPALLNRPLTSGDRLWTGPRARSELHVGSTALRLSEQTSLDFLTLDDNVAQLRLAQGTLQLRVRALFEGQRLEVDTPNLAFVISEPGNYRLDVSPASDSTRVVVQSGSGVIYGDGGAAVNLGSQQQASYTGTQLVPAAPGPAWLDSFDHWAADRDRLEDQSISARYVPRETIGYQQLDAYGDWRHDPVYGAVWLPRAVPVNWAPYRMGHWDWIAPWGWTWIDDAPWGFAPFHYGRWTLIGLHWAWVPGRLPARPVYAPALVVFVGGGSAGLNWSISIGSAGLARPALGWFPLAPGEAFRPHYRVSPRYVSQVNQNIVVNNTVNLTNVYRYQRQPAAVTAVSRDDFTRGRPVRGNQHVLSATDLRRAQVVAERSALPQRPEVRERPRPVAPAALPPATVITRPVVRSRNGSRDEPRAGRPDNKDRTARTQPPLPAAPVMPGVTAAQPPVLRSVPAPAQDRSAIDAEQRTRREQQPLQRDQERQQRELNRQQPPRDQPRQQGEASPGQRALRAPVENNGNARPVMPDAQAERAQQQLQRDQQRQQAERVRQQEEQRRQSEEALGQRALREQAQKQQELARQQQQAQQRQARELQQQQQLEQRKEQAQQRQAREQQQQQRAQQDQQRQEQAAQAQKQAQQQQRAQQDQQRQARELQQQQQLEQPKEQAEERKKARQTDAAKTRPPRPEGEPIRNREP